MKTVKKNLEFQEIIQSKDKVYNGSFVVAGIDKVGFKIGITVPKRLGKATVRNLNRRQIKEIVKKNEIFLENKWIVLITRSKFLKLKFSEKEKEVLKIINFFNSKYGRNRKKRESE